ncbi:TetR family transcriptional regulator [Neptunicella marina]|uniref:TetR family transcriptional regulator n=1 Tax=Neptunicella marina TaxID=2125989 RepID=A0A8J6IRF5_9ALTE|nr:TetR family transcriptional regulator [Neptunicella marina]MBC3766135.1 TetR family transcriptional regulator [Neptunicella marina]
MVRKTKEEAAATRDQLLDSAESVFFDKGFANTTLMDVANHAGLTRGAIYWHFKNKHDLFEAMIERVHLPIEALAEACADENETDPLGKFKEFSVQLIRLIATDKRQQRVFSIMLHKFEFNGDVTQIEDRQKVSFVECHDRIKRTLKNAIKRGQLPKDLDLDQAAQVKHGYFTGIVNNWLFYPQSFDLNAMAETIVENYFFLLTNSPHMRLSQQQAVA